MRRQLGIYSKDGSLQLSICSRADIIGDIAIQAVDIDGNPLDCPNIVMFYGHGSDVDTYDYDYYVPDSVKRLIASKFKFPLLPNGAVAPSLLYLDEPLEIKALDIFRMIRAERVADSIVFLYGDTPFFTLGPRGLTLNCGVILNGKHMDCDWIGLEDTAYSWAYGSGVVRTGRVDIAEVEGDEDE